MSKNTSRCVLSLDLIALGHGDSSRLLIVTGSRNGATRTNASHSLPLLELPDRLLEVPGAGTRILTFWLMLLALLLLPLANARSPRLVLVPTHLTIHLHPPRIIPQSPSENTFLYHTTTTYFSFCHQTHRSWSLAHPSQPSLDFLIVALVLLCLSSLPAARAPPPAYPIPAL